MSVEYQISLSSDVTSLDSLASGLSGLGLVVTSQSGTHLSLARPEVNVEQLRRWGGDVQITSEPGRLLLTINAVGLCSRVLDAIGAALALEGIESEIEEL